MGKESQIVEFVLKGSYKNLDNALDKVKEKLQGVADVTGRLFTYNVANAAIGLIPGLKQVIKLAAELIEPFAEHVQTMEDYRREAGLTSAEIGEFSQLVISSSTKYGIALGRVASMAAFVGKGLGSSRKEAVALAGAMVNLSDATNITDSTVQDFTSDLYRLFDVTKNKTQNLIYGLTQMSIDSHAPLETTMDLLAGAEDALLSMPIEKAVREYGAFANAMEAVGAKTEYTREMLNTLGDVTSLSRRKLDAITSRGGGLSQFLAEITEQSRALTDKYDAGIIKRASYLRSMAAQAEIYGTNTQALLKMGKAQRRMTEFTSGFNAVQARTVEQNALIYGERMSPLVRMRKKLEKWKNVVTGQFDSLWGSHSPVWGYTATFFNFIDDRLEKTIAGFKEAKRIMDWVWGVEETPVFKETSNEQRYISVISRIDDISNKLAAQGRTADADRFYATEVRNAASMFDSALDRMRSSRRQPLRPIQPNIELGENPKPAIERMALLKRLVDTTVESLDFAKAKEKRRREGYGPNYDNFKGTIYQNGAFRGGRDERVGKMMTGR